MSAPVVRAVLPVKRLVFAKLRLAWALSPKERQELARLMFADVLDTLAGVDGLAGILVVTADSWVAAMARRRQADVLHDAEEAGTNAAVQQALVRLDALDGGFLVVPSDVPFVTACELRRAITTLDAVPIALAPALQDGGTNLLACSTPRLLAPEFGPDSFARHLMAARRAGVEPVVLHLAGAGHDVDRPGDLLGLPPEGGRLTRAFLAPLDTAARLGRPTIAASGSWP